MTAAECYWSILFIGLLFFYDCKPIIRGGYTVAAGFFLGIMSEHIVEGNKPMMIFFAFVYFLAGMYVLITEKIIKDNGGKPS